MASQTPIKDESAGDINQAGASRLTAGTWEVMTPTIPEALRSILHTQDEPAIVVKDDKIVACNTAWQHLCGFTADESLGKSPKILQGELTDTAKAARFNEELHEYGISSTTLCNYTKSGKPFFHRIRGLHVRDGEGGDSYFYTEGVAVGDEGIRKAILPSAWTKATSLGSWGLAAAAGIALISAATFACPGWAEQWVQEQTDAVANSAAMMTLTPGWLLCSTLLLVVAAVATSLEGSAHGVAGDEASEASAASAEETDRWVVVSALVLMLNGLAFVALPPGISMMIAVPFAIATLSRLLLRSLEPAPASPTGSRPPATSPARKAAVAAAASATGAWRSVSRALAAVEWDRSEPAALASAMALTLVGVVLASYVQQPLPSPSPSPSPPPVAKARGTLECVPTFLGPVCFESLGTLQCVPTVLGPLCFESLVPPSHIVDMLA